MKTILWTLLISILLCGTLISQTSKEATPAATDPSTMTTPAPTQQLILWTSGDREVALKMVFMYAYNCKKHSWMDNVRLLIWGPSGKLLTEDSELQEQLKGLKEIGVELYACKGCADLYGISEKLTELGVTVMYTGKMLADLQKERRYILSI